MVWPLLQKGDRLNSYGSEEHRRNQGESIRQALADKKAAGWVSTSSRSTGKRWKVPNRASNACKPECTCKRHSLRNGGQFKVGSTQTHPNSLAQGRANVAVINRARKQWPNGTSYEGKFTYTLRSQVWDRDSNECQDCERAMLAGERAGVVHHIDFNKGHSVLDNLVLLCRSCHIKRHNRDWHGQIISK